MPGSIKLRTSIREGVVTVRAIIRHPMDTGYEGDPETGKIIPPHYIENVSVYHNTDLVMQCDWSRAVSRNPYFSFKFETGSPGDHLLVEWQDNMGQSDSAKFIIE